jgi:hypothetical protein
MVLALRAEEGRHDRELTLIALVTPFFSPRHVAGDAGAVGNPAPWRSGQCAAVDEAIRGPAPEWLARGLRARRRRAEPHAQWVGPGRGFQRSPQCRSSMSAQIHSPAVVIWLGYAIWWEHPGAELGCFFFASLAVVGTWGDQPPSGVVGGGPRVTRRVVPPAVPR